MRELEEMDVWPESEEEEEEEEEEEGEPPRYSHLFAVHEHPKRDMVNTMVILACKTSLIVGSKSL